MGKNSDSLFETKLHATFYDFFSFPLMSLWALYLKLSGHYKKPGHQWHLQQIFCLFSFLSLMAPPRFYGYRIFTFILFTCLLEI